MIWEHAGFSSGLSLQSERYQLYVDPLLTVAQLDTSFCWSLLIMNFP